MKGDKERGSSITSVALFVVLLAVLVGTFYFHGVSSAAYAAASIKSHLIKVKPEYTPAGKVGQNGMFTCQSDSAAFRCYTPGQIRRAYDIQRVLAAGIKGAGRTVVIIDAFQSPTIRQDLDRFDQIFGLHKAKLNIIAPDGLTPFDPGDPIQVGWSAEISLDVEWAHAIAPNATIDLVLARDSQDTSILSVTKYAIDNNLGDVISQSFGEAESCMDPQLMSLQHQAFREATKKGITLLASSGDAGSAQQACSGSSFLLSVSTPASDPLVTAVGGTYLNADAARGTYIGESAWNETDVVDGASGGGFSSVYDRPNYQEGFARNAMRGVPDIAYDASVNGGVLVVWSSSGQGQGLLFIFGGTSAGSPQWAGIIALVDQFVGTRVGFINPILYEDFAGQYATYFHDITAGNNALITTGLSGYNTRIGWDAVTGLGSFIVGNSILGSSADEASQVKWDENTSTGGL